MNIQTILKKTLKKDLTKAGKLVVRELEEETQGCFIAFVDDNEHSFDVGVNCIDDEVVQLNCDCSTIEGTCLHKIAVLLQLSPKNTTTTTAKTKATTRKRKISESEQLLMNLDKTVLANWLTEIFKKNKPLEQQFLLTLGTAELNYTAEQVKSIVEQTIKSVVGKRVTLEGNNVKKMLDLLKIALEPINQYVMINIHKSIAYEIFAVVLEAIIHFDRHVRTYSKKTDTFYENYIHWFAVTTNTIQDESLWKETVRNHIDRTFTQRRPNYKTYNDSLVRLLYTTSSMNQRSFIVAEIELYLCNSELKRRDLDVDFVLFLKEMALDENIFDQVELFFKVEPFQWMR